MWHEEDLTKLKSDFQQNGFVVVPSFLASHQVQELNDSLNRVLHYLKSDHSIKQTHFYRGTRIVYEQDKLHRIVWAQGMEHSFALTTSKQRMNGLVNALLDQDYEAPLIQIINQLHIKSPGDGVQFRYHQDAENRMFGTELWDDILDNGSFIQTILALGPLNEANGTLKFLVGSHKEGYLNLKSTPEKLQGLSGRYKEFAITAAAGDLVLFHPFCIHGSSENRSQELRKVFINGFCPPGANKRNYPGCGLGLKL